MNIDLAKDRRAQERPSDALDGNIPVKLTREELRDLSALSPPRSTFHILAEWTLIFTAISLCQRHFSLVTYVLTVAFIGARQHALLILMHDGVHYRLFRGRRLNDWTAEVILAWPNLISARCVSQEPLRASSLLEYCSGSRLGAPAGRFDAGCFPSTGAGSRF